MKLLGRRGWDDDIGRGLVVQVFASRGREAHLKSAHQGRPGTRTSGAPRNCSWVLRLQLFAPPTLGGILRGRKLRHNEAVGGSGIRGGIVGGGHVVGCSGAAQGRHNFLVCGLLSWADVVTDNVEVYTDSVLLKMLPCLVYTVDFFF
jgi:hypothetical protein